MWLVAGVLLGTTLLATLAGFHAFVHGHLLAAIVGLGAAGWLIAMAASGQASALLFVLLGADLALSAGVGFGAWRVLRQAGRRPVGALSSARLEGLEGIAVGALAPEGIVRVRGEQWSARSLNGPIEPGTPVQVIRAEGVRLEVWGEAGEGIMIIGIVVAVVVLAGIVSAALSVKIVREYQRIVLFRLGRVVAARGPGLVLINPITDRTSVVDLREQYLEIPHQVAITKDNAPISIDFIIFYKVMDATTTVLTVRDFSGAALNIAATTLRAVVGDMPLDDVLSKREEMNAVLRVRLDEVTERWGVKVTSVEVREVNPPPGVQEAMTRQMSAERTRRAQVTEAEGRKSAAILSAEGERQAAILSAEGAQQAAILSAEGERQAALLRAQGYSSGLDTIAGVAHGLDRNTLLLQYLDTLKQVGSSPSTKLVVPMELAGLLKGLGGLVGAGEVADATSAPARVRPEVAKSPEVVKNGAGVQPTAEQPAI